MLAPGAWDAFDAARQAEEAAVFRAVVREPFVSAREALEALCAARPPGVLDPADPFAPPTLRIYDGPESLAITDALAPRSGDRSIAGYVRRLQRGLGEPAIVVNAFQAASPRVFRRSLEVLVPLYERIGLPAGGALLDLFAGSYRRSPLGVHKDEQDVLTFVLHGRKRFLVWPFELLARRFGVGAAARLEPHALEGVDPDSLRAEATVLEAGPGDLVYWPTSAWHFAESDGGVVATLALGVFPRTGPLHLLERTARALTLAASLDGRASTLRYDVDALPFSRTDAARRRATVLRHAALRRLLASPDAREAEEVAFEAWRSALGYARVPAPLDAFALAPAAVVRVPVPETLSWSMQRRLLVVFAAGHVLRLPRHARVVALLDLLREGRPHTVRALVRRFARARAGEPGLAPDAVMYVLAFLGRSHTLVRHR